MSSADPGPVVAHPESLSPDAGVSLIQAFAQLQDALDRDRPTYADRSVIEAIVAVLVALANSSSSSASTTTSGGA